MSVEAIDPQAITTASDLSRTDRKIWVVTTAALPWRTGTSVNPLARALYLTRGRPKNSVILMVPWLPDKQEQGKIFGTGCTFDSRVEQEQWIRNYSIERVHCEDEVGNMRIEFYDATYNASFGSIFATEDVCACIPDDEADFCILEEPEHLTWFRVPPSTEGIEDEAVRERAELGWKHKFTHVVGILHTNYSAYVERYGVGASLIAASALHGLSSLVVRAYCHKVIRLSATLPALDMGREVTCNVHGVRSEFLSPPQPSEENNQTDLSPVYFIGKLIWAKGIDKMLSIQEAYKRKTGAYFPIDVYGSGGDEEAIKRAFFGRKGVLHAKEEESRTEAALENASDRTAAVFFDEAGSLRSQVEESKAEYPTYYVPTRSAGNMPNPIDILGGVSGEVINTGRSATMAGARVGGKLVNFGVHATFSEDGHDNTSFPDADQLTDHPRKLRFDPPKSVFELRRHAVPGRFLGMKDHAWLRDITRHKVFLNPSETEVLCTTSSEALAMGKFLVLPRHPSNDFFLQFPNCLPYSDFDECVERLEWAMANDPKPLSEEDRYKLTWEGANERLAEFAAVTNGEAHSWEESGRLKSDQEAARLHLETMKKGASVHSILKM